MCRGSMGRLETAQSGEMCRVQESWGSLKTGALRGWICVGLQWGGAGEPGQSDEAGGAGRQPSSGVESERGLSGKGAR